MTFEIIALQEAAAVFARKPHDGWIDVVRRISFSQSHSSRSQCMNKQHRVFSAYQARYARTMMKMRRFTGTITVQTPF
jgi:hypothetical protein